MINGPHGLLGDFIRVRSMASGRVRKERADKLSVGWVGSYCCHEMSLFVKNEGGDPSKFVLYSISIIISKQW